jgi:hypothetical protein
LYFHHQPVDKAIQSLSSDSVRGLTDSQVSEKRAQHGENKLREKKQKED